MSSRSTPRDGSDFTHLPSSSASLAHVNGHGPDTPLPISPHDMSEDDNDEFLYQDSDPMLQQPYTQQLLKGNTHIKGPNTICKVIFLTICLAGLQFTWTVEMAYGTPYLLSLGLSKSVMSLVWIAGPLSGLLMQPIVGVLSDRCTSRFGRRRPFLVLGSVVVIFSLLVIGWTREITSLFTATQDGDTFKIASIAIAITSIYVLDFSINCVQASCRALLVDALPPSQQEDGTAWAGRMVGLGNVAGYFMGYADLVKAFPFFGDTQLKVLCVIAAIVLALADAITCYTVSEKILTKEPEKKKSWGSSFKAITAITSNIWNLPTPIRRICNVQFFAWFGWFPFLFYSTTWVAEIYDETALDGSGSGDDTSDAVGQATRAGSFAFLVYSLVSLGASFVLPLIVTPSYDDQKKAAPSFQICIRGKTYTITPSKYLKIKYLNIQRAWTASHFIFLIAMFSTFFVSNVAGASIVIGVCGISWAMTMWAPFSLLGEYISEMEDVKQQQQRMGDGNDDDENHLGMHPMAMSSKVSLAAGGAGLGTEGGLYQLVEQELESDPEETDAGIEMRQSAPKKQSRHSLPSMDREQPSSSNDMQSNHPNDEDDHAIMLTSRMDQEHNNNNNLDSSDTNSSSIPSAGVLLGIHNMFIVMPQFLVTFLSSIIFHFLENGSSKSEEASPSTIAIVLRFGAVMAGVAGYLSTRIGREN
ncbi:MFS general substrate transporter [Lichtheimia hyalospora FSU 10163]|nr:MFS general substrate transporter [Lichtheimia hyalospora FSU 10163]